MITKDNIREALLSLSFEEESPSVFARHFGEDIMRVDMNAQTLAYADGITVENRNICNFSHPEYFVQFECVCRLLEKGYHSGHIILEHQYIEGRSSTGGKPDIIVRDNFENDYLIIECKNADEYDKAWQDTMETGGQLFGYFQNANNPKNLCLYTSDFADRAVTCNYRLIQVTDIETVNKKGVKAKKYSDANTDRAYKFQVWKETYFQHSDTIGIFEPSKNAYAIGTDKRTVDDLRKVGSNEMDRTYNKYAKILRKHNVGTGENAFDKLVNLFLSKVVDELTHGDDLQFVWRGAACDDDYHLQDRLQRLYRDGMKKFLGEDVTYIEEAAVDKAFRRFKADPDSTKQTIAEYFRALKFYSDNDFSFISVHNKRLFEQNAVILREVVCMLQDYQLKTDDTNQFLGNLFEGFLTKGVKQTEGQFFTPMPIVSFMVSSLPLEQIVRTSPHIPSAIDYSCGAGHFLTEYASQVKSIVARLHPEIAVSEYCKQIMGIEKEYRLSKVAKVSAFMYGNDDMQIVYADALLSDDRVKENAWDVLIANPPYAVQGFLETMPESERERYEVFSKSLSPDKNNAIEVFFIERAKQLLRAGGVAAIVMPVSILNKGGIYLKARQIILKYFDLVALVTPGKGTFGKTSTETVILFMRRKETNNPDCEHYANRVRSWFNEHHEPDAVYLDEPLLVAYCSHCGYDLAAYKRFLAGEITATMAESATFKVYAASFKSTSSSAMKGVTEEAKTVRTAFRQRSNTQKWKKRPREEQEADFNSSYLAFTTAIEREKLYYFLLAVNIPNDVVVVKSPGGTKENKKFLGYEWSEKKGHEGLVCLNTTATASSDNDDEDEDDTIKSLNDVSRIVTPLYNPKDLNDGSKVNSLIRTNFNSPEEIEVPLPLQGYVSIVPLIDMIGFSLSSFPIALTTTLTQQMTIESRYDCERLQELLVQINGYKTKIEQNEILKEGTTPVVTQENGRIIAGYTDSTEVITDLPLILFGDHSCTIKYIDFPFVRGADGTQLIKVDTSKVLTKYLYYVLRILDITNKGKYERHFKYVKNALLPIPPLSVQQQIVSECEAIDAEIKECCKTIYNNQRLTTELSDRLDTECRSEKAKSYRLSDNNVFDISIGRRVTSQDFVIDGKYPAYSANVFNPFGRVNETIIKDFSTPSVLWGIDGDWMVNYLPAGKEFHPTDHCGVLRVKNTSIILPRLLAVLLRKAGEMRGFTRVYRASVERVATLAIKVPPIEYQQEYVSTYKTYEARIAEAEAVMAGCEARKRAVLKRYL